MNRIRVELCATWLHDGGKYRRQVSGGVRWYVGDIETNQTEELERRLGGIGRVYYGQDLNLTVLYLSPKVAVDDNVGRVEDILDRMFGDRPTSAHQ